MAQRIGLKQIAQACGISMSTVSRALSGDPRVNERTRRRIQVAAQTLQLKQGRPISPQPRSASPCLALVQPAHEGQPGDTEISIHVMERLQEFGEEHNLTIISGRLHRDKHGLAALGVNGRLQVAGVIGYRLLDEDMEYFHKAVRQARVPCVILNRLPSDINAPVCSVDHRQAGELAANHLLEQGHQRIGVIFNKLDNQSTRLRLESIEQVLAQAGRPLSHQLRRTEVNDPMAARDMAVELVRQGATALILCSDRQGLVVQSHLIARGYTVPNDVSVLAFDGTDAAAMASPALTSVYTPWQEMAQGAAQLIQMFERNALLSQAQLIWQPKLMTGESCAPPKGHAT